MTISHILFFCLIAILISWLIPSKWKLTTLLITSIISIYWLQPASTIRHIDFWLPSIALILSVFTWFVVQKDSHPSLSQFGKTAGFIILTVVSLSLLRYIEPLCCLTASKPPQISSVIIFLLVSCLLIYLIYRQTHQKTLLSKVMIFVLFSLLIILKSPTLAEKSSALLRSIIGQDISLASSVDITWLGFSYLCFRLVHVLLDSNSGRLGEISLANFLNYALFFPSYTAGPIDRVGRFNSDLRMIENLPEEKSLIQRFTRLIQSTNFISGAQRILIGIFKKFVLADGLALIALNDQNATQIQSGFWGVVLIYAFSLRIYLDFSGYTDIAIGIGNLLGIELPENFDKPYQKTDLTTFWNSWHITLAQWFRAYFFNPITRYLRSRPSQFPVWMIVLIGQAGTMLLIGLWHGITWNFAIWGLWHGFGLFINNRWSQWKRSRQNTQIETKASHRIASAINWFITFNYVSLGWVWFALSEPSKSLSLIQKLFSF